MLLAHSIDALNMFDKEEVGFDSPSTGIGKEKRTLAKLLNYVKLMSAYNSKCKKLAELVDEWRLIELVDEWRLAIV